MRVSTSYLWCLTAAACCLACDSTPLVAPTESTLHLVVSDTIVPSGGSTTVTARVVESAGTPVHDGTVVSFSATLGTVHPPEAPTARGSARATFTAGQASGVAEIRAYSGVAVSEPVQVTVGAAAVASVRLTIQPGSLPPGGGEATLTALVLDVNQNPIPNVRVVFGTTAGTLRPGVAATGGDGEARTVLRTTATADVSASAGGAEAAATVRVDTPTEITITPTPAAPVAGQPVTFALTLVNETRAIRGVTIAFGDGETRALGAVAAATVTHTYQEAGVRTVTVRATDVAGHVAVSSIVIEVAPPPGIPVTLSAAPAEPVAGQPVTFTVTITPPNGAPAVRDVTIDFGDGAKAESLGAPSGSRTVAHVYGAQGSYIATVTVADAAGRQSRASVGVTVRAAPRIGVELSASPAAPVAGEPVTFTVRVTSPAGAPAVRDVVIDFGDDSEDESLGAVNGSRTVAHVYAETGSYIATVTARDVAGRRSTASIGITVEADSSE
ncbi:MAG: PKD domain-containing protein [Acidobacteria bacterium]|nr:PKD domain-containing protein [Acidobacteriota bacterium]